MRCRECDHPNPESNKFCGECGAKLEGRAARVKEPVPGASGEDLERRDTERERVRDSGAHVLRAEQKIPSSVIVQEKFPPATPEEGAEEEKASIAADTEAAKRSTRVTGIGGPSILGLGYETSADPAGFVYDKPRHDGFIYDTDGSTPEYLLDDMPGRTVSWRAWALLLVLVTAGGLGYLQWRANRGQGPNLLAVARGYMSKTTPSNSPPANGPGATSNASPATATNPASAPASNSNGPQQTASQATGQASSTSTPATQPDSQNSAPQSTSTLSSDSQDDQQSDASNNQAAASGDKNAADKSAPADQAGDKTAKATVDKTAAVENSQSAEEDNSATSTQPDEVEKPESDQPAKSSAKPARRKIAAAQGEPAESLKPKPLGDKDPLVVQAENYIQGRGTPKNCSAAVNLLRQSVSQGNPAADVKLGALYWSGTCVTQSKVTAYQWFTRAHTLEPTNRWVERSRNSMWASMNEREKQAASY